MNKMCIFGKYLCINVSNELEKYRIESTLKKDAETIAWINARDAKINDISYDADINIGIYSFDTRFKYKALSVSSFEPTSNNWKNFVRTAC